MSPLAEASAEYLALRRAVGFKLERPGRLLGHFVAFAEAQGSPRVTVRLALEWANGAASAGAAARRLQALRGFARWFQCLDPASEVPPTGLLAGTAHRVAPYLFSPEEVVALMRAARDLRPALRAATTETAIGLLACTGMRIGEVLRLDRGDVDFEAGTLTIWRTKFNKSRQLPLSASTLDALAAYDRLRESLAEHDRTPSFFVSFRGGRLGHGAIHGAFVALLDATGIPARPCPRRPRMHDLRHGFTVATLVGWYREGRDVEVLLPRLSTYLGHVNPGFHLLVCQRRPGTAAPGRRSPRARRPVMSALAPALEAFFTDRLGRQRNASPHTIASYRDTFRLLLGFARARTGKEPCRLDFADVDAELVGAFLAHLEADRHNSVQTRNTRLTAIRSFYRFASYREPAHAALIQRVLAIPEKRTRRTVVSFLTPAEINALLAAPDRSTWTGRRDHALLCLTAQTGLRVSELTGMQTGHVVLGVGPHMRVEGKGRKQRATPADPPQRRRAAHLAGGTRPRPRRTAVPHPQRHSPQLRRRRRPSGQTRRQCHHHLPVAEDQARDPSRPAPLQRHGTQSPGRRHLGDRPLARSRTRPNDPALPPRRPLHQRTRPGPHRPSHDPARPLPSTGQAPSLPGGPLNMPGRHHRNP